MISLLCTYTLSRIYTKISREVFAVESSPKNSYGPPVDQLLTYGEGQLVRPDQWPDYLQLGLGPEHIPELIRMATDEELNWADSESLEVWAPLHAWRAIGQLRAEAAIEPFLSLLEMGDESDWVLEELPEVYGMIGPAALPTLAAYLADDTHDETPRISAISSIENIGQRWPEARAASVALLMKQLEQFTANDPEINGFLISALVDLQAREAAPLIERAFATRTVDETIMGDWDDAQVQLGLKIPGEIEQKHAAKRLPETPFPSTGRAVTVPSDKERRQREATHKKTKSQMVKQSRKKNRKR
jgi:hypothetical protein